MTIKQLTQLPLKPTPLVLLCPWGKILYGTVFCFKFQLHCKIKIKNIRIYQAIRQMALKSTICGILHYASQTKNLRGSFKF